jgi:hypothetical protein
VQMHREVGSQAFAHGQDVYFGAGKGPGKDALTAHELTHVVQQTGKKSQEINNKVLRISSLNDDQGSYATKIRLKHLSIPETVDNFAKIVKPKNESQNSATTITNSGQFYWTGKISADIYGYLTPFKAIFTGNQTMQALILSIEDGVKDARNANAWSVRIKEDILAIRERINRSIKLGSLSSNDALAMGLLGLFSFLLRDTSKTGKEIYYELWRNLNSNDLIPDLSQYRSLPILEKVINWENQACGYTGNQVASRFTQKGGAKKDNPDAKRRKSTQVGATFASSGERDMRKLSNGLRIGDTLIQNGVGSIVPKMQIALDDGWILHARILSGLGYGETEHARAFDKQEAMGKPPKQPQQLASPPQEHSIMLIGYDGNEFVFWDPDSGSSHTHGAGFGSVFFADGKLSTAQNTADMPVNDAGYHHGEHRYQIITINSQ